MIPYKLLDWIDEDNIYDFALSKNSNAIEFIKTNIPDKICWYYLCSNTSDDAISMLKENKDKIDWLAISTNTNAISLLEENQDKINWYLLSKNEGDA
jgi:uncharacterized cysteine cluster protein YcgN (CxxCxxCC family)